MKKKSKSKFKLTETEQDCVNVLKSHKHKLDRIKNILDTSEAVSCNAIDESVNTLIRHGVNSSLELSQKHLNLKPYKRPIEIVDSFNETEWKQLVASAKQEIGEDASIEDILLPEEIEKAAERLVLLRGNFSEIHRLDKIDWLIAGISGTLAALVDIFLVQMPAHPGFLGGESFHGGPLSNWIREKIKASISPEELTNLEQENWVPYDPSTSNSLKVKVDGLGPRTHRFQSLGHDPVLGFIFGVKDILRGSFTALDTNGKLIRQTVDMSSEAQGMSIFIAILRQFGHLKSDVSTSAGLPAPIMPLIQLIQSGSFGKRGYTLGELSRIMYRQGYDFSHFISMSIPVLMIEVLVRGSYFFKRLNEGYDMMEALPVNIPGGKMKPKLQTMLFTAHTISTTVNLSKTAITENPLAVNFPQWLMFFKSLFAQLNWVLAKKEKFFSEYFNKALGEDWISINRELNSLWTKVMIAQEGGDI